VRKAFGDRWILFAEAREEFDSGDRVLSKYSVRRLADPSVGRYGRDV
jgi:hypothetical protein